MLIMNSKTPGSLCLSSSEPYLYHYMCLLPMRGGRENGGAGTVARDGRVRAMTSGPLRPGKQTVSTSDLGYCLNCGGAC